MEREGVAELEISDGDCLIVLRRGAAESRETGQDGVEKDLVTSPLQGILRLRSSTENSLFADAGDRKRRGEVLFYIEAMKRINEVYAEFDLMVEDVLCVDGEAVAQGQAIMRVRKAEI